MVVHTFIDLLYLCFDSLHSSHCLVVVVSILSTKTLYQYDNNTAGGED